MNTDPHLFLSCYEEIATINAEHNVTLVQHKDSKKIYVKKILRFYNTSVFNYLLENQINGLPHIHDLIEDNGKLYLIEEYVSGSTLQEIVDVHGAFSDEKICDYMLKLCDTISKLHLTNPPIIHRDIKPSNIILTPSEDIVLLDLDAAKHVSSNQMDTNLLGTKGYAAPEQYGFGSSNVTTDIYSIGMLINTLTLGHYSSSVNKKSIFSNIIEKCTNLDPKKRFHSVNELQCSLMALPVHKKPSVSNTSQGWQRFLPPGFRTNNIFHILPAAFVYFMLFFLFLNLDMSNTTRLILYYERCCFIMTFLVCIFFSFNYLNIHSKIILCNSSNQYIRAFGIIFFTVVIFLSLITLMLIGELIIGYIV